MHIVVNLMDEIFSSLRHVGHLPRRFPSALPVDNIGYVPRKTSWVRFEFSTYNFSFILSGEGEYWHEGRCWPVRAPCVITQAPGLSLEYGPTGERGEWEELYLIYNRSRIPVLEKRGLIRREIPAWNIKDIGPTRARLLELSRAGDGGRESGFADRVDRLCELMVMESILGETSGSVTREERAILEIRSGVEADLHGDHDFDALARRHGLSASTFRRYWATLVGVPPARYVMRLKIGEACRLLVETRMKIGEIAEAVGFNDPLYFSRRFRMETGVAAAEYRESHAAPLSFSRRS
jgi:AraC-like DNA-binding protein